MRPSADGQTMMAGQPTELFATRMFRGGTPTSNYKFGYDVSADGSRFLIAQPVFDEAVPPLVVVLNWKLSAPAVR